MGVIVAFDYAAWALRYPEFNSTVTQPQANECFVGATMIHANDGSGPVNDAQQQTVLLNALTAHIAQISFGSTQQQASGIVGRIASATEGTVSVTTENRYPEGTAQWFQQTKYGSFYWAATMQFRTMRYSAPRPRFFNPPPRG